MPDDASGKPSAGTWRRFAATGWRDIVLLGLVSLIAEVSGEMMSALLPFLLISQSAGGLAIGLVGGVTDGVGDFFKLVGGHLGQRTRRPRLLIGAGYLVAALSRFGVAAAPTWPMTLGARSLDRVGKGLRTAPRDAMLANLSSPETRGRAFGLHLAGDVTGALVAVALVAVLFGVLGMSPRTLVVAAACIGVFAVLPLFWVRDQAFGERGVDARSAAAAPEYTSFLLVASLFAAGRVSYMFFVVAATLAYGTATALGLYVAFTAVQAASAWLWGLLGDRWGKRRSLAIGYVLAAAGAAFMLGGTLAWMVAGFLAFGLSVGCVDSLSRALAAQVTGGTQQTARLGEYHALTGFAGLLGGIAVGLLWDNWSPDVAFAWGAVVPLLAALGLMRLRRGHPHAWRGDGHVLP